MTPTLQHVATEALRLEEDSRAQLAAILLESLEEPVPSDAEMERRLLKEADRRDRELASGAVEGRSWDDVLAAARARLR